MRWVTVQLGPMFNSGWAFEMSDGTAQGKQSTEHFDSHSECLISNLGFLFLWSLKTRLCSKLAQMPHLPQGFVFF